MAGFGRLFRPYYRQHLMLLLQSLGHPNMVHNNTEEQRQADCWNHPRASQVVVHVRLAEADKGDKSQTQTSSASNSESDDCACATLMAGKRDEAEKSGEDECETTLVCSSVIKVE